MRTRYAPTPSGFLHIGNAANLLATSRLAEGYGAQIALRIDDVDVARTRTEYLQDVFAILEWLELPWNRGPRGIQDVAAWSQRARLQDYRRALEELHASGMTYVCGCPRSAWGDYVGDDCPAGCRGLRLRYSPGASSWRLHLAGIPDPVIWRRDDLPAYHLASVVDDDLWNITLVVRGADLVESTHVQRRLSAMLPGSSFHRAVVVHHRLAVDESGRKLSKSAGHGRTPLARTDDVRHLIHRLADEFVAQVSVDLPRSPGS